MPKIFKQRMTAVFNKEGDKEKDEEFVVFLIGMRINKWWKIHKWLPVAIAMPKMIKELYANPEMGLLAKSLGLDVPPLWCSIGDHLSI